MGIRGEIKERLDRCEIGTRWNERGAGSTAPQSGWQQVVDQAQSGVPCHGRCAVAEIFHDRWKSAAIEIKIF